MILHGILLAAAVLSADAPRPDEASLIRLINQERTARHLAPLSWDGALARLARRHAADMRDAGRISHHSTADGADFAERLARTDYRAQAAAENVALDRDVARAHQGLMNSPGHRANILSPDLTAVGIGVAEGNDGSVYVVEDFATPVPGLSDAEAVSKVRDALARARQRAAGARKLEEDSDLSRRLAGTVERMIAADSVKADAKAGFDVGWVFSYTSMSPSSLPRDAEAKVARAQAYAIALAFRKTRSYPFGTWWVVLALKGGP